MGGFLQLALLLGCAARQCYPVADALPAAKILAFLAGVRAKPDKVESGPLVS